MSNLSVKYIKKSIIVEAEQWMGCNISTISEFMATGKTDFITNLAYKGIIQLLTLEGITTIRIGDWIIKEPNGKLYLCRNLDFKREYDCA